MAEARRELQRDKNIEEGKNVPAMNLKELEVKQRNKEHLKNVKEETKDLFSEDDRKEQEIQNVPSAPNLPKPPKESLASRAKRLAAKGKELKDKAGTSLGDAYIKYGKKNLKPSGNPKRITTGGRKQPRRITMGGKQPKPATSPKQEGGSKPLSEDVKEQLKGAGMKGFNIDKIIDSSSKKPISSASREVLQQVREKLKTQNPNNPVIPVIDAKLKN